MEGQRVGVVGLGQMGMPIATKLLESGFTVVGVDPVPQARAQAAAAGVDVVETAAQLAAAVDVVITSLPDLDLVRSVLLGDDGVAAAPGPLPLALDMSTGDPDSARALAADAAARGLTYLDAPVTGGPAGAAAGSLGIMVGGDPAAYEQAAPVLHALGRVVVLCGDSGAGQVVKACNQLIVIATLGAVAEALTMVERSGVDPARAREVLLAGYAASPILENQGLRMIEGDFAPRGKARFNVKDIHTLARLSADAHLPVPVFEAAGTYIQQLVDSGGADLDHCAVISIVRAQGDRPS